MTTIPTRRLCAECGTAFLRLPGQPIASFIRRIACAPCATADEPEPITADLADVPRPPSPPVGGASAAL